MKNNFENFSKNKNNEWIADEDCKNEYSMWVHNKKNRKNSGYYLSSNTSEIFYDLNITLNHDMKYNDYYIMKYHNVISVINDNWIEVLKLQSPFLESAKLMKK